MRLFFAVFCLCYFSVVFLYAVDTEDANENPVPHIPGVDEKYLELSKQLASDPKCKQIVSGFVTHIQKQRARGHIFQVTMIVKKVFRREEETKHITFSYARINRLKNTSDSGLESAPVIHHRSRTLESNSEGPTIMPAAHQRARSFDVDSDPTVIQLHSTIIAYLTEDESGYRMLGFIPGNIPPSSPLPRKEVSEINESPY